MPEWKVGQQVAVNRQRIETITHVTRGGRATVGERVFNPDGSQRGATSVWHKWEKIEPLTQEVEEETKNYIRSYILRNNLNGALHKAETWLRGRENPLSVTDMKKAEKMLAAIKGVLKP